MRRAVRSVVRRCAAASRLDYPSAGATHRLREDPNAGRHCSPFRAVVSVVAGALLLSAVTTEARASDWYHRSPAGAEVVFMVEADAKLLVGTRRGLLYASSDGGASWTLDPVLGNRAASLVVNPRNRAHWYLSEVSIVGQSNAGYVNVQYSGRRIVTRDNGATWSAAGYSGGQPVFHPSAPKVMTSGGDGRWFSSLDDGVTWTQYGTAGTAAAIRLIGVDIPGAPFAGAFNATLSADFRITDSAVSDWVATVANVDGGGGLSWFNRPSQSGHVIWRAGYSPFPGNRPYSELGVVDFNNGNETSLPDVVGGLRSLLEQAGSTRLLALVAPNIGFCDNCARQQVWSLDSPSGPWTVRSTALARSKLSSSLEQLGGKLWLLDETIGVRRSDDGGLTWSVSNNGLREGVAAAVSIDPRNAHQLLAGRPLQSLQRSTDGGLTWMDVGGDIPQDVRALARSPVNPDRLLATAMEGLYRSTDGGANWQRLTTAVDPAIGTDGWRKLAWCANTDVDVLATVANRVYRSADGGVNWSAVADPGSVGIGELYTAIAAPGRTYLKAWSGNGFYATADCGQTAAPVTGANAVAVNPYDAMKLVGYRNSTRRFYSSHDGGATWADTPAPIYSNDLRLVGWIDGCNADQFTNLKLHTVSGDGVRTEVPGREDVDTLARAAESRCIDGESVTLMSNDAGVWLYRGGGDPIFADAFEP